MSRPRKDIIRGQIRQTQNRIHEVQAGPSHQHIASGALDDLLRTDIPSICTYLEELIQEIDELDDSILG